MPPPYVRRRQAEHAESGYPHRVSALPDPYDVFVSYRQVDPDQRWVHGTLLPALVAAGLRVFGDQERFMLNASVVGEMERAVASSRFTLAVVTPAYLRSAWIDLQAVLARDLGREHAERRLVVVVREPAEMPLRLRAFLWLDMTDDSAFPMLARRLCGALGVRTG
jgi:TIR domain